MLAALRASRMSSAKRRRSAMAEAVYKPCFKALQLPAGAPPPAPCILQTNLPLTASDRHRCRERFDRARHRGLPCIGDGCLSIRLFLQF